jgi:hypothetical protein
MTITGSRKINRMKFSRMQFPTSHKQQVLWHAVSGTFVESTNVSPGPISEFLFAQQSGSSGITDAREGLPACAGTGI